MSSDAPIIKRYSRPWHHYLKVILIPAIILACVLYFGWPSILLGWKARDEYTLFAYFTITVGLIMFSIGSLMGMYAIAIYADGLIRFYTPFLSVWVPAQTLRVIRVDESENAIRIYHDGGYISIGLSDRPAKTAIEHFDEFLDNIRILNPDVQIGEFPMPRQQPVVETIVVQPVETIEPRIWSLPMLPIIWPIVLPIALPIFFFLLNLHGSGYDWRIFSAWMRHPENWTAYIFIILFGILMFGDFTVRGLTTVFEVTLTKRHLLAFRRCIGTVVIKPHAITHITSTSQFISIYYVGGNLRVPMAMPDLYELVKTLHTLNPQVTLNLLDGSDLRSLPPRT